MITMQKACEVLKEKYPEYAKSMKGVHCIEYEKGFMFNVGQFGFTPFVDKRSGKILTTEPIDVMLDYATGVSLNSVAFDE